MVYNKVIQKFTLLPQLECCRMSIITSAHYIPTHRRFVKTERFKTRNATNEYLIHNHKKNLITVSYLHV